MDDSSNNLTEKIELAKRAMDNQKNIVQSFVLMSENIANHAANTLNKIESINNLSKNADQLSMEGQGQMDSLVSQICQIDAAAESMMGRVKL